ncbi:hypothetical protein HDV04_006107 [Boothiomyces sp. JEL0838]|nr:hypothetical protein HDV04_006107 [Boothiomyces sp. JEL0838]
MKAFRNNSSIASPFYYLSQFNTSNLESFQSLVTDDFINSFFTNIQINNYCHVKKLILKNSYLVTASSIELILKFTTLKHVEFSWIQLEAEQYLYSNITYLNVLSVYTLFANSININIKGLRKLVLHKPELSTDNIQTEYDKLVHLNLAFVCCNQLFNYKYLKLQELYLKNTKPVITDELFKSLIDACIGLKELHLEDHEIGDGSLLYLNKSHSAKSLEYLGLVRCLITAKGIESLRLSRLKAMDVSGNKINKQLITFLLSKPQFVNVELLIK